MEETVSTMEELTASVNQSAGSFDRANQLARQASHVADQGGTIVKQVKRNMDEIDSSAKRIADISGAIDGIAFQTNILALNAAVEAARAGDQGRGFAVVATEVRQLAHRSASAAKEIKSLIAESIDKAKEGNRLVVEAERTMVEIVQATGQVSQIMAEVTSSAREQSRGIDQINEALFQMNASVQQNAAVVEEAAAAAESQKIQAQQLLAEVSVFKLSGDSTGVPRAYAKAKGTTRAIPQREAVVARPRPALSPVNAAGEDWQEF